jgi:hypothetical protein
MLSIKSGLQSHSCQYPNCFIDHFLDLSQGRPIICCFTCAPNVELLKVAVQGESVGCSEHAPNTNARCYVERLFNCARDICHYRRGQWKKTLERLFAVLDCVREMNFSRQRNWSPGAHSAACPLPYMQSNSGIPYHWRRDNQLRPKSLEPEVCTWNQSVCPKDTSIPEGTVSTPGAKANGPRIWVKSPRSRLAPGASECIPISGSVIRGIRFDIPEPVVS